MRHGRRGRLRRLVVMLAVSGFLTACSGTDLYSQLNEKQANEIIAALQSAQISADKRSKDTVVWTVRVAQSDFARAVDTLRAQGLPREEFESLGRVFRKEGFVSSPLEERARLNYGMSQELSHTLSSIDGVVVAGLLRFDEAVALEEVALDGVEGLGGGGVEPALGVFGDARGGAQAEGGEDDANDKGDAEDKYGEADEEDEGNRGGRERPRGRCALH
jgi:hypothetical protein